MNLNGEMQAVKTVIDLADTYGYGNLICRLKMGWMMRLKSDGMLWEAAASGALLSRTEIRQILKRVDKDEAHFIQGMNEFIGQE